MQTGTIVMMAFMLTVVWGGFAALIVRGMRIDRRRRQEAGKPHPEPGGDGERGSADG